MPSCVVVIVVVVVVLGGLLGVELRLGLEPGLVVFDHGSRHIALDRVL